MDPRQHGLHPRDRVDDISAGLLEHDQQDGGFFLGERPDGHILRAFDRLAQIANPDRPAVAIGDDDIVVFLGFLQLIIGRDGEALVPAVDIALGRVRRGERDRSTDVLECQPVGLQLGRIDLDAHRRLLFAPDHDLRHTVDLGNLLSRHRIGQVV
ncbi:MAG TPA: hypothetical protein VJ454_11690, partial [Steroidobacteraceae bacterium]|nr:hypothetical protein [Steroidobacteraceae bacterium]